MWEETTNQSSRQLYTISRAEWTYLSTDLPVNPLRIRIISQRIKVVIKQPDGSVRDILIKECPSERVWSSNGKEGLGICKRLVRERSSCEV
jgi:hypothetical protein